MIKVPDTRLHEELSRSKIRHELLREQYCRDREEIERRRCALLDKLHELDARESAVCAREEAVAAHLRRSRHHHAKHIIEEEYCEDAYCSPTGSAISHAPSTVRLRGHHY